MGVRRLKTDSETATARIKGQTKPEATGLGLPTLGAQTPMTVAKPRMLINTRYAARRYHMKKWRWADSLLSGAGCTYPSTIGDGYGDGDAYIRQYWNTHGSDDQPIDERIEKPEMYGPQRHCYQVIE